MKWFKMGMFRGKRSLGYIIISETPTSEKTTFIKT